MRLRDIVVEQAVIPRLAATRRDDAIREIVDSLCSCGAISPEMREEFVAAVLRRENTGSTGFGHGVAVPHAKHTAVSRMMVTVAISQQGVEFNALDKQPVHSIFLLLSPADKPEDHLDAMEAIFGNLSKETFRRFLRQASGVQDVLTLLEEADARTALR